MMKPAVKITLQSSKVRLKVLIGRVNYTLECKYIYFLQLVPTCNLLVAISVYISLRERATRVQLLRAPSWTVLTNLRLSHNLGNLVCIEYHSMSRIKHINTCKSIVRPNNCYPYAVCKPLASYSQIRDLYLAYDLWALD